MQFDWFIDFYIWLFEFSIGIEVLAKTASKKSAKVRSKSTTPQKKARNEIQKSTDTAASDDVAPPADAGTPTDAATSMNTTGNDQLEENTGAMVPKSTKKRTNVAKGI